MGARSEAEVNAPGSYSFDTAIGEKLRAAEAVCPQPQRSACYTMSNHNKFHTNHL